MRKPTELPSSLKTIDMKAILRSRGIYFKQKMNKEAKEKALPVAREILKTTRKKAEVQRYRNFTNEIAIEYRQKQIHLIEVVEQHFENKLKQFITKVVTGFLAHLESEIITTKRLKRFNTKDYFDDTEEDYTSQALLDFTPLLESLATLAGQEAMKITGTNQVYIPFDYRNKIIENVKAFTQSMLETDRQKLISIITDGIQNGQSVPEIRSAIQADFEGEYTKNQATRITRTEVSRVSNQASLDAWEQSGVVEGKQWVTQGATDECADYDGQIESLDGNFYSDTTEFADGDPPLHPNCKCGTIPVLLNEDKVYTPDNKALRGRIIELEGMIDKRTKEFKELKGSKLDDELYIKSLEKHLGVEDD